MLVEALRPSPARTFVAVRSEVVVVLAIVVFLAANLPYLEAWPTAHNDEARELNAFWVASGADPGAVLMDTEFGRDPLYKGGLQGLSVSLALRLGGLGLFQGRLVSLLWGGVLLMLVFVLGRRLYGPLGGAVALMVLVVSRPFLVASHMIRPDIVLAAMLVAAAYLALRSLQEREAWASFAAGLLLGLALDVHLNAVAFAPLVGAIYLARLSGALWRDRSVWLFCLGGLVGFAYVAAVRVLADVQGFLVSKAYWIDLDKRPPILSGAGPLEMLLAEAGRFQGYFTEDRRLEALVLAAVVLAAGVGMVRARRPDPLLLGLMAALALFVTIVSGKSEFYVVLFYPWLALLTGGVVARFVEQVPIPRLLTLLMVVALTPLVFGVADNHDDMASAASNYEERGYYALLDEIRPLVPAGATVFGPPLFWLGLSNHPYTDYYVWERLRAQRRERFSEYMARLQPDVVVLDAKSRHQVSINSPGWLESNATLLKTIRRVGYDRVEVWKLS